MPSDSIPVILNPAARSARAGNRLEKIRGLSPRVAVHATAQAGDARRFAAELAAQGAPIVVAAGGDGTINEVVSGLATVPAERRPLLGVLPAGTMNVFAHELGLPAGDLAECWRIIEAGRTREIDLWEAGGHVFVQMAGVGLDAAVIENTSWRWKKRIGPLAYVVSLIQLLLRTSPRVRVSSPGREPVEGTAILLGNGRRYGGPFPVFPHAHNADGLLEVVVFKNHGPLALFQWARALWLGSYATAGNFHAFQATELTLDGPCSVPTEVDGELAGSTPVTIRRAEAGLRVLVG